MATTADLDFAMPFNGDSGEGVPGLVGPYSAENHSVVWRYGMSHLENINNRGPVRDVLNELDIGSVGASLVATIGTGAVFVRGVFALNSTQKTLDVPANATGSARKDMIVVRRNGAAAVNEIELAVLTGDAVNYPTPTQSALDDGVFEIPIWKWETPNAASDLTTVTFIDLRDWSNLPQVLASTMLNNTVGDIIAGSVVINDTSADEAYDITTLEGNPNVVGVNIAGETTSGASGRIAQQGIVNVRVTGAVVRGDFLTPSTTAGVARTAVSSESYFAKALTAFAGPGLGVVAAILQRGGELSGAIERLGGVNFVAGGGWTSIIFTTERADTFGMVDIGAQPTRITFTVAGEYQCNGGWTQQGTTGAWWDARVLLNGATQLFTTSGNCPTGQRAGCTLAGRYTFVVGDYIELQIINQSGASTYTGERFYMSAWRSI